MEVHTGERTGVQEFKTLDEFTAWLESNIAKSGGMFFAGYKEEGIQCWEGTIYPLDDEEEDG